MFQKDEQFLIGLSIREPNYSDFLNKNVDVNLIEVISENYFYTEGSKREDLIKIADEYAVHLHGVSLNIAGFEPFDLKLINKLKQLIQQTRPRLVSDHLCFTRISGKNSFDLLPFPFTKGMLRHLKERIDQLRDLIEFDIAFENISTYFRYDIDQMDECEFMTELQYHTNLKYLLDLNNLVVNQFNHNLNPLLLIDSLDSQCVAGFHLAGYLDEKTFYFDAHDSKVPDSVWDLYGKATQRFGIQPTIIERDENIPTTIELVKETNKAKMIVNNFTATKK